MALFANPALLRAKRRSMAAAGQPRSPPPRMSVALAAFTQPARAARASGSLLDDDAAAAGYGEAITVSVADEAGEGGAVAEAEAEAPAPEPDAASAEPEADDYMDEDEEVREAAARAAKAAAAKKAAELALKAKKLAEAAATTAVEPKKLIIKEGVIHGEVVAAKTFTLRRVEKVRGDKDLTALRAAASARKSVTPGALGYAPRQSSARILTGLAPHSDDRPISERETLGVATPYSFTTVARVATIVASSALRGKALPTPSAQKSS